MEIEKEERSRGEQEGKREWKRKQNRREKEGKGTQRGRGTEQEKPGRERGRGRGRGRQGERLREGPPMCGWVLMHATGYTLHVSCGSARKGQFTLRECLGGSRPQQVPAEQRLGAAVWCSDSLW